MGTTKAVLSALMLPVLLGAVVAYSALAEPPAGEEKKALTVTEKEAGKTITLQEQGELVVQLPGEGRGGRVWKVVKHDPKQLEPIVINKPEVVPAPKEKALGQTEFAVFRFKALKSGNLELHYVLPKVGEERPEKEFKVRVEVQPASPKPNR